MSGTELSEQIKITAVNMLFPYVSARACFRKKRYNRAAHKPSRSKKHANLSIRDTTPPLASVLSGESDKFVLGYDRKVSIRSKHVRERICRQAQIIFKAVRTPRKVSKAETAEIAIHLPVIKASTVYNWPQRFFPENSFLRRIGAVRWPVIAMRLASSVVLIFSLTLVASGAFGADFTRDEVQSMLAAAPRPNFAGRSLAGLDLHDLDFTAADLSGADLSDADLRGTKLVAAKLVGAKLSRAKLNLAWIMRADFSHADLSGAVLETLIVSNGMETLPNETARFVGANLSGAKVMARFSLDDMHGSDLSNLRASADMRNQSMGLIRTDFSRANLADTNFEGAELAHANFEFAKLQRANLSGADLSDADLAGADLTDANLTGAKTTGTKFTSATLTGVRGLSPR
jgi:uncharacterized protein YjbI with pentapeptide repeats